MPRCRSSDSESVCVVPASTLPASSMTPASYSSRSVRVVLPASTCARIPRFSSFCDTRHTLQIGPKGPVDGHERVAHRFSLVVWLAVVDLHHKGRRSARSALREPSAGVDAGLLLGPVLLEL